MQLVVELRSALWEIWRRAALEKRLGLFGDIRIVLRAFGYSWNVHDGRIAFTVVLLFDCMDDVRLPEYHISRVDRWDRDHRLLEAHMWVCLV